MTLGAIDDLIENNRRRIEVLEEMARAIYREWFVRFRYPGHEDGHLCSIPLGPDPRGLEESSRLDLHRAAVRTGGLCFAVKDYVDEAGLMEPSRTDVGR